MGRRAGMGLGRLAPLWGRGQEKGEGEVFWGLGQEWGKHGALLWEEDKIRERGAGHEKGAGAV